MNRVYTICTFILLISGAILFSGCSLQRMAMESFADSLANPGATFSGDEDPVLVGESLPFALKLMETVREGVPDHPGIHLALSSGFVQYAYGWVLLPAERLEDIDFDKSKVMKKRAAKLFLRAYRYAIRGLDLAQPGFETAYKNDPANALKMLEKEQVAQLYWMAGALAMAVSTSRDDTDMIQKLTKIGPLLEHAAELDESWNKGTIHDALVSYYAAVGESLGGGEEKAKRHFERALELNGGHRAGTYLAWAEGFSVTKQDKEGFISLCKKAKDVDPEKEPNNKLVNILMIDRAEWLLSRVDDLFL